MEQGSPSPTFCSPFPAPVWIFDGVGIQTLETCHHHWFMSTTVLAGPSGPPRTSGDQSDNQAWEVQKMPQRSWTWTARSPLCSHNSLMPKVPPASSSLPSRAGPQTSPQSLIRGWHQRSQPRGPRRGWGANSRGLTAKAWSPL